MEKAGYVFDVVTSDLDEKAIEENDPYQRPLLLARVKMEALIPQINEPAILITCDEVVACGGKLLEKPQSKEEVRERLEDYSNGAIPEAITAIVVFNTKTKKQFEDYLLKKLNKKHNKCYQY